MPLNLYYSRDYFEARRRFREAAVVAGGRLEAFPLDARGPGGEPLFIDVALWGTGGCRKVLIVSSGLHGVEGAFGSAIQLAWLLCRGRQGRLPPDLALVLPHALNPYGFAWTRRWNEEGVDLNRNFLHDPEEVVRDPRYWQALAIHAELRDVLNPRGSPSRFDPFLPRAVRAILVQGWRTRRSQPLAERFPPWAIGRLFRAGRLALQRALPIGQYAWPGCLFYGGSRPSQTTTILQEQMPRWLGDADEILHIDLHSGLGKYGEYRLLIPDAEDSVMARWFHERFGPVVEPAATGQTAYQAHGVMGNCFKIRFADKTYRFATAEFGTYPPIRVLGVLRAENHAHRRARPGSRTWTWAKRELLEMFCPADRNWRRQAVEQGVTLVDSALAALSDRACPG